MPKKKRSLKEKRAQKRKILIGVGVALCILVIVGIAFLARLPEVTISEIRVNGVSYIEENDVRNLVTEVLAGSYFYLVPHRNSLFYPEHTIERTLKETLYPVRLVDITRDGFKAIVVAIEERQPVATWCLEKASSSSCYLMDESGFLFEQGEKTPTFVTYTGGISGEPLGTHFINGEFPKLRAVISDMYAATGRSVDTVTIDEYDDLYVYFREGGEIRFVRTYESDALLENIASVFSSKRFDTEESFEYADFRFGNKVYVKFWGE